MARGAPSSSRVAAPAADPQASQRTWTPLREDYFQPPLLSSRERQYLVRKSCEAAQELVERARSAGGPISWRHVEKSNGVQVYAGAPRSGAAGAALSAASMCGVTCVPGTVKEVASLFQLGSSRSMKEFARAHREWFYDGVVLHTLAPRTKEKPLHQVTAKWMVVQTPHGLPHRDFCYLECQDKFIDARGRKGWVLGQHSIKLPGCDELKKEFGLVRGSLYHSGFVVVESEERPGHVDVIHLVQINFKEHTPVPASFLRARVVFVAQVRNMLRSKRLNEQRYLSDLELVPRKYRARCSVCQDSFSLLLLRKLNCRKCGEVVCAACSKEFPIENRNFAATNGGEEVRKLRICMHCFQVITNAPKPTSALAEPPHSSTMSMSFMGYHDDEKRASYMTQRSRRHGHGEDEAPKIFLQSMRREKPRQRMSSTSPIPNFGADMTPSTSRHRTAGDEEYGQLYERSQRYQQQRQDHGRSHHQHRGSQRMRPSEFRPSMSLSLDDPISRGEGRDTLQMPGPPRVAPPASIFDRPANGPSRRPPSGLPRSNSSDMLLGTGGNLSNFSRLQELSSRERQEQMMRQNQYLARSSIDKMPNAYMSALQQASRDKHEFAAPPPMYQVPPSDFGAYGRTLAEHQALPSDFGSYDTSLDDSPDMCPPLDMSALTSSESTIPISLTSMSNAEMPTPVPTSTPSPIPVSRSRSRGRDREREREVQNERERARRLEQERERAHAREMARERERQSTSSDSSAISIDIDTYDDPQPISIAPPIAEQQYDGNTGSARVPLANEVPMRNVVVPKQNSNKPAYAHEADEDSEASMGASDDEEERTQNFKQPPPLFSPSPQLHHVDDGVEETKAQEFAETPALPPPSPSAHTATRKVLERESIAYSLGGSPLKDITSAEPGHERPKHFDGQQNVVSSASKGAVTHRNLSGRDRQQDVGPDESILGDLTPDEEPQVKAQTNGVRNDDHEVDTVARKYTMVGSTNENEEEDLVDHEHRDSEEAESDGDSFAQRDSELLLNTAGCDMNYLDADMRQFHDQSLFMRPNRSGDAPTFHGDRSFSSQLKDNMSALPVTASNEALLAPANKVINQESHVATPPYEHLPTSPKHKSEKSLDSAPRTTRPTIHRDDTFALERMDLEERQVSRTAPAGHIVLDAMGDKSSPTAVEMSTIRTDDRFVIANGSMVSAPVEGDAESLTFHEGQPNNELTPPVVPISVSSSSQEAEGDIVQTSGDELSEVRSRASSRMSFSSAPSARSSSVCSSRLDLASPPATPPTSSPAPISRLSATSASSPVAVASALELAASNDAFTLRANGSPEVTPASNHNTNSAPPAYVPDRFRKMEQSHEMQFTPKQAAALPSSKTPRQSGDSGAALDNFQLDFSASFSTNQDRSASGGNDLVVEGITRLPPPEERNRAGSTGSNDVRVRYQPFGSSVLDTVPDSDVLSTSASEDEDDSEDENMLLSARQLYERFGNTSKLSQMAGGNRPGFQRTLSQIQQSFDQLSDSESEDDTRVSTVAARRR